MNASLGFAISEMCEMQGPHDAHMMLPSLQAFTLSFQCHKACVVDDLLSNCSHILHHTVDWHGVHHVDQIPQVGFNRLLVHIVH